MLAYRWSQSTHRDRRGCDEEQLARCLSTVAKAMKVTSHRVLNLIFHESAPFTAIEKFKVSFNHHKDFFFSLVLVRRRTATRRRRLHSSAKRIVCGFTCCENFDWLAEDIEDRIVVHRYFLGDKNCRLDRILQAKSSCLSRT